MFTNFVTDNTTDNGTYHGTRRTSNSTTEGGTGTKTTANVAKLSVAHKLFVLCVH